MGLQAAHGGVTQSGLQQAQQRGNGFLRRSALCATLRRKAGK